MFALLSYCLLVHLCLVQHAAGATLEWRTTYHLKAIMKMPSANITVPYEAWVNDVDRRLDFYDGMTKIYATRFRYFRLLKKLYMVNPQSNDSYKNRMKCRKLGMVSSAATVVEKMVLPSSEKMKIESKEDLDGIKTIRWSKIVKVENHSAVMNHTVWTHSKSVVVDDEEVWVPIRYEYRLFNNGIELEYVQHFYTKFTVDEPDSTIFELPVELSCPENKTAHIDPVLEFVSPDLHSELSGDFQRFKSMHNKQYNTKDEHFKRFNIYKKNLRYIEYKNSQQSSYKLTANRFTDIEDKENQSCISKISEKAIDSLTDYHDDDSVEKDLSYMIKFDWRWYGAITSVKDQASCGSCYAFATAAIMESTAYISRGCKDMEEVSEQALLDCSWPEGDSPGNNGCEGGNYNFTMEWVMKHGLPFRQEYGPYLSMPGYCHMNQSRLLKIHGFKQLPRNVTAMKEFIRNNGPIVAGIHFPKSAIFFSGGIYDDPECSSLPEDTSHAVVIVGYGHDKGRKYWIVKNSWGPQWGDEGYFKLSMDSNTCGAANFPFGVYFQKSTAQHCHIIKS